VTLDVESIKNNYSELVGNLIVSPGPALLDPVTNGLKQNLSVAVTSATKPVRRTWSRSMLPGVFPVPFTLGRDIERWPFDRYYTGPITVELFTGAGQVPTRANVTFVDRLPGWKVHVTRANNATALAPYKIELPRSASTMVFAIVILCILVAIATVAMFVAVQTLRAADVQAMAARLVASVGDLKETIAPAGLGLSCQVSAAATNAANVDVAAFTAGLAARVGVHATAVTQADSCYLAQEAKSASELAAVAPPLLSV
jgi:Domain of unknown function (DUF4436)